MIRRRLALTAIALAAVLPLAQAQMITAPGINAPRQLYPPVGTVLTNVGNGADLTEDVLQTYTLPANTLLNIGDRIVITAGGTLGATTDVKTVRVKFGGAGINPGVWAVTNATSYRLDVSIIKTGSSTQSVTGSSSAANGNQNITTSSAQTLNDTGTLVIQITGQNSTNSVAGSITCRYFTVDYWPAPSS